MALLKVVGVYKEFQVAADLRVILGVRHMEFMAAIVAVPYMEPWEQI